MNFGKKEDPIVCNVGYILDTSKKRVTANTGSLVIKETTSVPCRNKSSHRVGVTLG